MQHAEILTLTRDYILENFLYMRPDAQLRDDESLLGGGIVDSMGVMELVQFIGDRFGVTIADDDITEEHFGSVASIAAFVAARTTDAKVA